MRLNLGVLGMVALLAAGMASPALAQGPGHPRHGERIAQALGLSPEQKQKIATFREAAAKQAEPYRAQLAAKMKEMKQLWLVDQPDKAAIRQKQAEMEPIMHQLRDVWTDFRLQVHAILTPEQRAKAAELGPGMGMGHGHGRGGPWMHEHELGGPGCLCDHGAPEVP